MRNVLIFAIAKRVLLVIGTATQRLRVASPITLRRVLLNLTKNRYELRHPTRRRCVAPHCWP